MAMVYSKASPRRFVLTRLHSLAGILPLGMFLLEHLYSNALALLGPDAYDKQVHMLQSLPFLIVIEVLFIGLPLLYHAGYGLYIAFIARNNAISYSYTRNWMFTLQRASGVLTLIFVIYHLWAFRISNLMFGAPVNYQAVQEHLANPMILLFYMVGVVATIFHFTNGIWAGLITWGITVGAASQKISAKITFVLFIVLSLAGIATLFSF
ncbi:succinate dehydrogenase cytochrome b558 subunit [Paenibacillus alginolyticus]|uniref:succinate dehydrogenase cytochrome b558 subunit n=1 Tax=Paenibacillus alginolyticus TaxID=59839 RepID=UPI0024847332|nr:succinate dehydrogenase cytochrome b558 subunit [Paenibacillus frigoriresistens]